jgi:transposase-like protein
MANTRDPHLEQFWRNAIADWKKSQQNICAYCAKHRLAPSSFYSWRRELAKRDRAKPLPAQSPALKFLPVQLRADACLQEALLEIALPNGLVIRAPARAEAANVAALAAALVAALGLGSTPC